MRKYGKYFNVEVKPEFSPVIMFAAGFTAKDLLFDWTAFKVPNGGNRLMGITAVVRSNDGADQTCAMDIFIARTSVGAGDVAAGTAPTSMGTPHDAATTNPANPYWGDIVGHMKLTADNFSTVGAVESGMTVGTTGRQAGDDSTPGLVGPSPLILDGYGSSTENLDDSEGFYTYYLGATAIGTPNFDSNLAYVSGTGNDITVDGINAGLYLAPGDRIKALDITDNTTIIDIGTVGTVPDDTSILLKDEATSIGTLADGDLIFNIHPIKLILHFER